LAALRDEYGLIAEASAASKEIEAARREVEQAEHEFDSYISEPLLLTTLGKKRFMEGAQTRRLALEQALAHLDELRAKSELAEELTSGALLEAWPTLSIQEKRKLLHGLLEQVLLTRSESRGQAAKPIADRTAIIFRGGARLT
jgi:hypothetical protein